MVILKQNGVIYIATSYINMPSCVQENDFVNHPENFLMWHPSNEEKKLIATTSNRAADALRYEDIFPKRLTIKALTEKIFFDAYKIFAKTDMVEGIDKGLCNTIYFASNDKAYIMYRYSGIEEIEDFDSQTSNDDVAYGSYLMNKDKPAIDLIKTIYSDVEKASCRIQFPVAVMSTKNNKITYIYREDEI